MIPDPTYRFDADIQTGIFNNSTYYWLLLPTKTAKAITQMQSGKKRLGWGSVRIMALIGDSNWRTSLFPNHGTYLLLLNAKIRKAEKIIEGSRIRVNVTLLP